MQMSDMAKVGQVAALESARPALQMLELLFAGEPIGQPGTRRSYTYPKSRGPVCDYASGDQHPSRC